jgi:hypothetical protein
LKTPHPIEGEPTLPRYFTRPDPVRRHRVTDAHRGAEVRTPSGDDYEYEPDRPYDFEFEVEDTPEFVETPLLDASGQKLWRRNRQAVGFLAKHDEQD